MDTITTVVRELQQLLDAPRTAPEWRWNAHRRIAVASSVLRSPEHVVPAQARPCHDDMTTRLDDLVDGVLDRLHADAVVREVDALVRRLEETRAS